MNRNCCTILSEEFFCGLFYGNMPSLTRSKSGIKAGKSENIFTFFSQIIFLVFYFNFVSRRLCGKYNILSGLRNLLHQNILLEGYVEIKKITIVGMGTWGTTLAILLAEKGYQIVAWEWIPERADAMQKGRVNKIFLPECRFPKNLTVTNNLKEATGFGDLIVLALPSHAMRSTIEPVKNELKGRYIVSVTKGLEVGTRQRMSEVIIEVTKNPPEKVSALYGPTHAEEVSKKLPATIVAASVDKQFATTVQKVFMTDYLRVYTSQDIIGVELGGSLKNVIAIGAGVIDGLHLGDNAKASLIIRGAREITRLGIKCGARVHTFSGISGIGDLIVTCTSRHSRNRYVGEQLAQGKTLTEITESMEMVAEGIKTTEAAVGLSKKFDVDMPITHEIHKILFKGLDPRIGVKNLMTRAAKSEDEF